MALYDKWDVKNDFAYVLQFFSLISDSLGSVDDVLDPVQQYWKFDAFDRKLSSSRKADFVKSWEMLQIAFSWNKLFLIDRR